MRYLIRVLGLPFFLWLLIVGFTWVILQKAYCWVRYGGEASNYNDKMNRATIALVFYELKAQQDKWKDKI